jgi:hypothetical protein
MTHQMYTNGRRHTPPKRDVLLDLGLTGLSIIAALILLPAVGFSTLVRGIFPKAHEEADLGWLYD